MKKFNRKQKKVKNAPTFIEQVEALYAQILQAPHIAEHYIQLGTLLESRQLVSEALSLYEQGLRHCPGHGLLKMNYGLLLYKSGDIQQGRQLIDAAKAMLTSPDPEEVKAYQTLFALAQNQFEKKQFNEAEKSLAELLKMAPEDPIILCYYGTCLQYLLRFEEAEKYYSQVLKHASFAQYPQLNSSVYFNLALIDLHRVWEPQLQAEYLKAWSLNPRLTPQLYCLSRRLLAQNLQSFETYVLNMPANQEQAVMLELLADACVHRGLLNEAGHFYTLALARSSESIKSRYVLALLAIQRGQTEQLGSWLLPLAELHQNFAPVMTADSLLSQAGVPLISALQSLSNKLPENTAWQSVLGLFYMHLGEFEALGALAENADSEPLMLFFKARALQASGKKSEAIAFYEKLIQDLNWAQQGALLSSTYRQYSELVAVDIQTRYAEDFAWAKELNPELSPQLFSLKHAFEAQGPAKAVTHFKAYLELNPQLLEKPQLLCYLAENHRKNQEYKEAEALIKQALEIQSNCVLAYCQMILNFVEAEERYRIHDWVDQLEKKSQRPQLFPRMLFRFGIMSNAPEIVGLWQNFESQAGPRLYQTNREVNQLIHEGEEEKAVLRCNQFLRQFPKQIEVIVIKAHCLNQLSRHQEAYELLFPVVQDQYLHGGIAAEYAKACLGLGKIEASPNYLDLALAAPDIHIANRKAIYFALGKLHEKQGMTDQAFAFYVKGNNLKSGRWNRKQHQAILQATMHSFTRENSAQYIGGDALSRPVFIVGMPRSGTSLVEQIISSHPEVFGAGEQNFINQLNEDILQYKNLNLWTQELRGELTFEGLREQLQSHFLTRYRALKSADWSRCAQLYLRQIQALCDHKTYSLISDKMPNNFMHLGLIQQLFPNALVIHCRRHPLDICLSCFSIDFRNLKFTSDLENLGHYFKWYQEIMAHWAKNLNLNLFEIHYEELIANQEQVSRNLIAYLGLEWDPRCLQFFKTRRHVETASYAQVRQPIYKSSIGRYRPFEKHLEPLKAWIDFSDWS